MLVLVQSYFPFKQDQLKTQCKQQGTLCLNTILEFFPTKNHFQWIGLGPFLGSTYQFWQVQCPKRKIYHPSPIFAFISNGYWYYVLLQEEGKTPRQEFTQSMGYLQFFEKANCQEKKSQNVRVKLIMCR